MAIKQAANSPAPVDQTFLVATFQISQNKEIKIITSFVNKNVAIAVSPLNVGAKNTQMSRM